MKKTLLTASLLLLLAAGANAQVLVAGWDFETTTTGGTLITASSVGNPSPLLYNANFGSGTIYLDGTNGSSTWTSGITNPEVTSFGGTSVNAGDGFATGASLALANSSANSKYAVFAFSMTGYTDLTISYATQATATGFNLQTWEYSTNGINWFALDTFDPKLGGTTSTTFASVGVVTLATTSGLDNAATAYVRLSLTGASATAGNNRLDNIQFNAIPEPTTYAMLLFAGGVMFWMVRRHRTQVS